MYKKQNDKHFDQLHGLANKKPSVLLVDDQPARAALLEQALLDNHFNVIAKMATAEGLMHVIEQQNPDIIVIDVDSPDRDTLEHISHLSQASEHPIVMFAEQDIPRTLQRTIGAGVSVYITQGLQPQLVTSIVEVTIARFREFQALRNELEKTKNALADRKYLEKAKGLLMQQKQCSEEEAYSAMRKMAMDKGQRIVCIAKNIIEIVDMLDGNIIGVNDA
jgi:response regulator NasT